MTATSPATPPSISDSLNRLWAKFLPETQRRIALLTAASVSYASGTLTDSQRVEAHQAAHKLAGVLGTFGLPHGTELARRIENEFAAEVVVSAGDLAKWIDELQALVDRRS